MAKSIEIILNSNNHFVLDKDIIYLKLDNETYEFANNLRKITIKQFQKLEEIENNSDLHEFYRKAEQISLLTGIELSKLYQVSFDSLKEVTDLIDFSTDFDFVKTININQFGFQFDTKAFLDKDLFKMLQDKDNFPKNLHKIVAKCYKPVKKIIKRNRFSRLFHKDLFKITIEKQDSDFEFIRNNFKMNHVFGLIKLFETLK